MMMLPAGSAGSIVISRRKEGLESAWLHHKGSAVFLMTVFWDSSIFILEQNMVERIQPEKTNERTSRYEDHSCYGKRDD